LHADASLAGALKESARWRVAYDDGLAIVFRQAPSGAAEGEQVFSGGSERGDAASWPLRRFQTLKTSDAKARDASNQ